MLKQIALGIVLLAGLLVGTAWADDALNNALVDAARYPDRAEIETLISKGADVNAKDNYWGRTPLHWAAYRGNKEVTELLITKGADVNVKDRDGQTSLHMAASEGKKEIAEFLLSKGADVNAKNNNGQTSLHEAANKEVAELLISKGLDVNAKDKYGTTPLYMAGGVRGNKEVAEFLIAKGADVNAKRSNGETTLHSATTRGYKEVAELLISKGADVNASEDSGRTPLHNAVFSEKKDVVAALLAAGANLDLKDKQNRTPLQMTGISLLSDAKTKQEIIALLQGQMAKRSNPRQMLNSLLEQFKGHSDNETLRKSIIDLALKLQPPPAIPQEAEDAAGRAAYIFKNAKSEENMLAAAKEFLRAIEAAPWVANYYYNLCTVLEKTPYTPQALHACKLYLEAVPNAADAPDMRQRIAGLQFAVDKNKEQIKQRTAYLGNQGADVLYQFGGVSGQVAGKNVAIKLVVDWQASPPKYQVFAACILEGDDVKGGAHDLVSTDTWITFCKTSFHLVIKPDGAGFVELGGGGSLRATLDDLFQRKQKALEQSPIFKDYGYGSEKGMRFYVAYLHGGRDNNYAGYAMYESDCNGNLLRQDTRALPDDFFSQESGKMRNQQFPILLDYMGKPQSGCNDKFQSKTDYKFGENE